jgi:undecaprenyl-diphosphatase
LKTVTCNLQPETCNFKTKMSYTYAIISGIVQGITEFLPVSSSGHLVILHHYFGYQHPHLLFNLFLHAGTLLAVFVYFWQDIVNMVRKEHKLLQAVVIGSLPTALIGYFFGGILESLFANIKIVGIMLFVTALFLFLADIAGNREKGRSTQSPGWIQAIIIGIVQGISIIPGISRSGSTISSAMLLKIDKAMAIKFSFLLSIPAITGAFFFRLLSLESDIAYLPEMALGAMVAFLFGLGSIYLLVKAVINGRLRFFAFYCMLMGLVAIIKGLGVGW